MVKTPEEYFSGQTFDNQDGQKDLTEAERAFINKYMGSEALGQLAKPAQPVAAAPAKTGKGGKTDEVSKGQPLKQLLKTEDRVQMVSFYVRDQLFLLPVATIHEVLRYLPLVRLPKAPPFVAGVVNLRGRVTPLLHLDALLTDTRYYRYSRSSFIIVCVAEQMQLGLIIDKVQSMYMIEQNKILWNAEGPLGASAEFLCAVADINDKVCGILDPDTLVTKLLTA